MIKAYWEKAHPRLTTSIWDITVKSVKLAISTSDKQAPDLTMAFATWRHFLVRFVPLGTFEAIHLRALDFEVTLAAYVIVCGFCVWTANRILVAPFWVNAPEPETSIHNYGARWITA